MRDGIEVIVNARLELNMTLEVGAVADTLTVSQGQAMLDLMDLSDNDLLDLHLARKPLAEVEPALDRSDVHEVLSMLRNR